MTAPTARIGLGSTLTFLTSGVEIEITKASWDGMQRTAHETTHLGTTLPGTGHHGSRTFKPGKVTDPGTIKVEGHIVAGSIDLIEGATERVRLKLPIESGETTPDTYEADGFVTSMGGIEIEPDGKIMVNFDVKLSGVVTYTPAA